MDITASPLRKHIKASPDCPSLPSSKTDNEHLSSFIMPPYVHTGPVDCSQDADCSSLAGKTAIVTGGANGLGEAYVRALVAAGYVSRLFISSQLIQAQSQRLRLYR